MSSPFVQIVFAVETTIKARTDYYYIREILGKYYYVGNNKPNFVYMGGKHNYCSLGVVEEIETLTKEYSITGGNSRVVYVCDKDKNMSDPHDFKFVQDLEAYCRIKRYELVWFVATIEEVLWGSKVSDKEKVDKAKQFLALKKINDVNKKKLSARSNVNSKGKSNVLTVLNTFPEITKK